MLIYLIGIFFSFSTLSMLFNPYFTTVSLGMFIIPINISVVFFCATFFIIDMITELYDDKVATKIIYSKVLFQFIFVLCGCYAVEFCNLGGTEMANIMHEMPNMMAGSVAASLISYKLSSHVMQWLKIKYDGQYLTLRYLVSTLPAEIIFSLIFSLFSFREGNNFIEFVRIVISLSATKALCSVFFSLVIVPITNILKKIESLDNNHLEIMPFSKTDF